MRKSSRSLLRRRRARPSPKVRRREVNDESKSTLQDCHITKCVLRTIENGKI
jgi:hypothetical protein